MFCWQFSRKTFGEIGFCFYSLSKDVCFAGFFFPPSDNFILFTICCDFILLVFSQNLVSEFRIVSDLMGTGHTREDGAVKWQLKTLKIAASQFLVVEEVEIC